MNVKTYKHSLYIIILWTFCNKLLQKNWMGVINTHTVEYLSRPVQSCHAYITV